MPNLDSPQWNQEFGVCEKHGLPEVPCLQCIAEHDPDITVSRTETDRDTLSFNPDLKLQDLFSPDKAWLVDRIQGLPSPLKRFQLHWQGGKKEIVEGTDITDACQKAGIGPVATLALDHYEEG